MSLWLEVQRPQNKGEKKKKKKKSSCLWHNLIKLVYISYEFEYSVLKLSWKGLNILTINVKKKKKVVNIKTNKP